MNEPNQTGMKASRLSDDERDDLAQLAQRAESRNRPIGLVVLALLVLLLAGTAAGLAWRREVRMKQAVTTRHAELMRLVDLSQELEALREQEATSDRGAEFDPIPDILTRLQAQADTAGLVLSGSPPRREFDGLSGGIRRVRYRYTVLTPSAEALLRWARNATDNIPGLRVHRLQVQPPTRRSPSEWRFELDFARIERLDNG